MKRRKRGKQTLKRKMLSILLLCAMSCILAVVIVSYMTIRMIQNDSIQESMQIYLEQITRELDSDYYDMIGIVNQMSPNGLIGSVTERYLSAEDNYDRYFEQKSLREELIKLGYVNTKLLGIAYYDPKEQKELIGNFNVRVLDPSYQTISKVVLPACKKGIFVGVILGLARAFGEALAVAMVIGKTRAFPKSLLYPTSNLTAAIAADMGNTADGGEHNLALWSMALLLFLISMFLIFLIHKLGGKKDEK